MMRLLEGSALENLDRKNINDIVGTAALNAHPQFFPYVEGARFVPYWDKLSRPMASFGSGRFKITTTAPPDPARLRYRFVFNDELYSLWEKASTRP